jgi:hypothetical protein
MMAPLWVQAGGHSLGMSKIAEAGVPESFLGLRGLVGGATVPDTPVYGH